MSDRNLKNRAVCAVVDGEHHVDLLDLDVTHNPGSADVQFLLVFFLLFVGQFPVETSLRESSVILPRAVQDLLVILGVHIRDLLRVGSDCPCLVEGVPVVREGWISQ